MSRIIDLRYYVPTAADTFFFDTNVWMYLYCPLGNYRRARIKAYDHFLKQIIQNKARVYISSLVLSEFFNAYLRLEFNILKKKKPKKYKDFKKDFRPTREYIELMSEIMSTIRSQILKLARRVDDRFSVLDINELFSTVEQADFNDAYYAIFSKFNSFAIVTDDGDFDMNKIDIRILTANDNLLKKR